jgi:hypothetical protein
MRVVGATLCGYLCDSEWPIGQMALGGMGDLIYCGKAPDAGLVGRSVQMYDRAGYAVFDTCRGSIQQVYVSIMLKI